MKIEIHDGERPEVLRALAGLMSALADANQADREEMDARLDAAVTKVDPVPLTPGDARTQFVVTEATYNGTAIVPAAEVTPKIPTVTDRHGEPVAANNGDTKPKRTRAKKVAEQLQLVPSAIRVPTPLIDRVLLQLTVPEESAAPLAPAAPVAAPEVLTVPVVPSVPTASVPDVSAIQPIPPTSITPGAATASVPPVPPTSVPAAPTTANSGATTVADTPKTFPELMRAISPALASKKLTADQLNAACAQAGATNLQGLLQNQGLVPAVFELVRGAL